GATALRPMPARAQRAPGRSGPWSFTASMRSRSDRRSPSTARRSSSRAGGSITAIPTSKSSRSSSAGRPEKDCTSADLSKEFETPDDVETNDGYAHALGVYRGAAHVVDTGRLYASRGLALILAGGPAGTRGPGARPRSGVRGALR